MSETEKCPKSKEIKAEKQPYPAKQSAMKSQPDSDLSNYAAAGKLTKVLTDIHQKKNRR